MPRYLMRSCCVPGKPSKPRHTDTWAVARRAPALVHVFSMRDSAGLPFGDLSADDDGEAGGRSREADEQPPSHA